MSMNKQIQELAQMIDKSSKILLSNKMVLANILQLTIPEFRNCTTEDIADKYIEGPTLVHNGLQNPKAKYIEGVTNDHTTDRQDICFKVILPDTEDVREVYVNVESQISFYPGYAKEKRGMYYGACMIANQYGTVFMHSDYDAIRKAYSIWICINVPERVANTFTRYHMKETQVIGNYHVPEKNYDVMEVDMINCGGNVNENYKGVFQLIDCLLSMDKETKEERIRVLKEEFNISIGEDMEGEMKDMCTLGEGIYYNALRVGEEKGEKKGILLSIRNLMESMGISCQEAMKNLKVPEEERETYEELLKQ